LITNFLRYFIFPFLFICLISSSLDGEPNLFSKVSYHYLTQNKETKEWNFIKVSGHTLLFKNGKKFNTNLYNLNYIGQVRNGDKAPFLIFSGRDCNECDANISIYIHSPSNGILMPENGKNRYQQPGVEKDIEDHSILYKARAFYGEILPGIHGVLWYQDQLMENNTRQKSLFLVDIKNGIIKETILKESGQLKLTLQLLKQGFCKEIQGVSYNSEP